MLSIDFWNIFWTMVNLLIFYLFAKKFLFGKILKVIEQRKEMIDGEFEKASKTQQEANELKEHYESVISTADEEGAKIVQDAKKNADAQYNRIVAQANEKADRMVKDAHSSIELERQAALRGIESDIAKIAMTAAEKIVENNSSAENDIRMYDEFLDEVDTDVTNSD